jgi:hypothetical protein
MRAHVRVSLDALRHVQEHGGCLFVWREDATVRAATAQPRPGIWSRQRAEGFDLCFAGGVAPAPRIRVELRTLPEPVLVAYDDGLQT